MPLLVCGDGVVSAENDKKRFWDKPRWQFFLLLPLFHFASVKLTFLCAVTPENEVVVWLPNAVLLASLLRFRGQRGWIMAILCFLAEISYPLPRLPTLQEILLSLGNVSEVTGIYLLLRRAGVSPTLERSRDLALFMLAGPFLGAMLAAIFAGIVIQTLEGGPTPYLTLMRLWWFGDALGLIIYTPLLLAFTQKQQDAIRLKGSDYAGLVFTAVLGVLVFSPLPGVAGQLPLSPMLLLPAISFLALRCSVRWTSLGIATTSLAVAWTLSIHRDSAGPVNVYLDMIEAQEFILVLSVIGLGFAVLLRELRMTERALEDKVRARTKALEDANAKLMALSTTDGLTGLANRRQFDDVLEREWDRARRNGEPLALLMLDVDWFKNYNDHYGHQMGDDCLRSLATIFANNIRRSSDLAARYGGEEFALIVPSTDVDGARTVAETICREVEILGLRHEASANGILTVSIGVAVMVPGAGQEPGALLAIADGALYQAKQSGRNRVIVATVGDKVTANS
jgi:diguanylate cyclase (GGDEF)-like protein